MTLTILMDTREPELADHPWGPFIPAQMYDCDIVVERATLDTGDFALKGFEEHARIERKAVTDLLGCLGQGRERFERELIRSRHLVSFCVVIEGSLTESLYNRGGLNQNSIIGTLASYTRRYSSFFFADSPQLAAEFSLRFLLGQAKEMIEEGRKLGLTMKKEKLCPSQP